MPDFELEYLDLCFEALLETGELLHLHFRSGQLLLTVVICGRELLDILALFLGHLRGLLVLLSLENELVLQIGELGRVDSWPRLLLHQHALHSHDLLRVSLQFYLILLQLCELQRPLHVLQLGLFECHVALELLDTLAELSILLDDLLRLVLLLHLFGVARPVENIPAALKSLELGWRLEERALVDDACEWEDRGLLVLVVRRANFYFIRQLVN